MILAWIVKFFSNSVFDWFLVITSINYVLVKLKLDYGLLGWMWFKWNFFEELFEFILIFGENTNFGKKLSKLILIDLLIRFIIIWWIYC